jgi:hypothetical protein
MAPVDTSTSSVFNLKGLITSKHHLRLVMLEELSPNRARQCSAQISFPLEYLLPASEICSAISPIWFVKSLAVLFVFSSSFLLSLSLFSPNVLRCRNKGAEKAAPPALPLREDEIIRKALNYLSSSQHYS